MAAVTVNSVKYNVNGSLRDQYYNITGNSGDTLTVGLSTIREVNHQSGSSMSSITTAAGSNSQTTITFTTTGAVAITAANVQVIGN
jgi:hypothetical protein